MYLHRASALNPVLWRRRGHNYRAATEQTPPVQQTLPMLPRDQWSTVHSPHHHI